MKVPTSKELSHDRTSVSSKYFHIRVSSGPPFFVMDWTDASVGFDRRNDGVLRIILQILYIIGTSVIRLELLLLSKCDIVGSSAPHSTH